MVDVTALLGVAYLAQRSVRSTEARVAVFLAVIALPQAHWALRTGHFVPVLALLALSGFLLTERRPFLAGVCFGLLALKPQYLPIPILYLLWTRNRQALLGAAGSLALLSGVGAVVMGPGAFVAQAQKLLNISLDHSALYVPVQQAWQYSWQGFLISAGIDPNPLLTIDLIALSLGATVLVWITRTPSVAKVAAALGMLLVAPYSSFYNWSLIAVAGVLLLRSDLRPRALIPILLSTGVLAAAATQKATPYPSLDVLGPGGTNGLYWLPLFALATVFLLAVVGLRRHEAVEPSGVVEETAETPAKPSREPAPQAAVPAPSRLTRAAKRAKKRARRKAVPESEVSRPARAPGLALGLAVAVVALASGYLLSAFVSQNAPFQPDLFARQAVLRALPADFPLPDGAKIEDAGRGTLLPYRVEWRTTQPVSEVAGIFGRKLEDGSWQIVLSDGGENEVRLRTIRSDAAGLMDIFAEVRVAETADGSVFSLEFTPIPTYKVPGFDDWLADRDAIP